MMAGEGIIYTAHIWAHQDGFRIIKTRRFRTQWGARRFASNETEGKASIEGAITEDRNDHIGHRIALYRSGIDTLAPDIKEPDDAETDLGIESITPKGKIMARPARETVTKKLTWAELLDLPDGAIVHVDQKYRPGNLPGKLTFDPETVDNYSDGYARFLCGDRRSMPNSQKKGLTIAEINARRIWVRRMIGAATRSESLPKMPFTGLTRQMIAKKAAALAGATPAAKQAPTSAAKATAKKKPAAKRATKPRKAAASTKKQAAKKTTANK